VPLTYIHSFIW